MLSSTWTSIEFGDNSKVCVTPKFEGTVPEKHGIWLSPAFFSLAKEPFANWLSLWVKALTTNDCDAANPSPPWCMVWSMQFLWFIYYTCILYILFFMLFHMYVIVCFVCHNVLFTQCCYLFVVCLCWCHVYDWVRERECGWVEWVFVYAACGAELCGAQQKSDVKMHWSALLGLSQFLNSGLWRM